MIPSQLKSEALVKDVKGHVGLKKEKKINKIPSECSYKDGSLDHIGGDIAQEVELSSGSRRVAGSIPPWVCRSVPEQDT